MLATGLFVFVAVIAQAANAAHSSDWNPAARDQILDIHNDFRRNEGGCQINKLEYDRDLESQAKVWAERCWFKHEMVEGRGENLAYSTYKYKEDQLIANAAQAWFDEKDDYVTGQGACQRSCHYTQLVWHDTQKVGCYSTRCPLLQEANAQDAWYFVCFYTPMGNKVGNEPYKMQCKAPCKPGQTEENGLCVGEVVVPCVDDNGSCGGWAKTGECDKNPNYMLKHCRKACGVCGGEVVVPCVDDNRSCKRRAKGGQCRRYPDYMRNHCRRACGVCGGEVVVPCVDDNISCKRRAKGGQCRRYPDYMRNNCKKACGVCH